MRIKQSMKLASAAALFAGILTKLTSTTSIVQRVKEHRVSHATILKLLGTFGAAAITAMLVSQASPPVAAASGASYTSDGKLMLPTGYRKWTFIGGALTPNGLNDGKAPFPEWHNVYIEDKNLTQYQKLGYFPEGTVIVKELVVLKRGDLPDGSLNTAAGRGFQQGEFQGLDVMVKDSKRFAATNRWGFFNFGHHALPYEENSKEASKEECAGCHISGVSKTDMVWVDFYLVLRGKN